MGRLIALSALLTISGSGYHVVSVDLRGLDARKVYVDLAQCVQVTEYGRLEAIPDEILCPIKRR